MFENAELGHKIDKEAYKTRMPEVRAALLDAQRRLAGSDFSVLVVIAGMPAAGKSEAVNLLHEWLDARGLRTIAMREPTDEERLRPPMWRFWRDLPPHGRMAIFFGGWDTGPLMDLLSGKKTLADVEYDLARYTEFERMLHREHTLLVKIWLHLTRDALKKRLKKLEADPIERWRVTRQDWKLHRRYDDYRLFSEQMLRRTSTGEAPWTIVESRDERYRNLTVGETLLGALRSRLAQVRVAEPRNPLTIVPPPLNVINALDLSKSLDAKTYEKELKHEQGELGRLTRDLRRERRSLILVFEGPDAAGKGGTIRRMTAAMDARDYRVISVAAPTDEEKAHPYLWRFWRHLPPRGQVTIYDRSWYGRVLVERVEGFATADEWQRAYSEINEFEAQLTEFGGVVRKFWLAIGPEEQLQRFTDREVTPYKQYKLTAEDWRNREKWDSYEAAACEMIERTSTHGAPWVLVEANNKEHARVKVIQTVTAALKEAFGR